MIFMVLLQHSDLYIGQQKLSLQLLFTTQVMTVFVCLNLTVPSPVPGPDKEKDREKEKEKEKEKDKETSQGKHPFGKDTKETDDSINMVKEKELDKEREREDKGLDKDQDIQIIVFKEPDQGGDKNVSVDTDKDVDKDPNLVTEGPKDPTEDVPKNTTKGHTDDDNKVQEKDTELKKDLGKGLDKDVHVEKGSENVLILKDLRPDKNTSKAKEDNANTVEEKTSEQDKDLGRGLDKDLHLDKGVLGVPKDRDNNDLGRDIEIVLLSEKGKTSVDKDVLIRTEYNLEKEESAQQRPVAITTAPPKTTTAPPTPETNNNDLDIKPSRNATDTVSSNDIENFEKSAPLEIDQKQHPVGDNITEQSSAGKADSDVRRAEDKETQPDTDSDSGVEKHPEKKVTADSTQPPKVTKEPEMRKDIKGDSRTETDQQSVTGKITGNPPFFGQGHPVLMNLSNSLQQGLIHIVII